MALYHFTMKTDRKPSGEKIMADVHAEYNGREGKYENLDEKKAAVDAADHVDYINRDASFAAKEGCVYKAHHLPKWAEDSPKKFFAAAVEHEESEHTYKELEFALQNELTLEQNLEIINAFVEKNFADYYYAYAVHTKEAALGNGVKNPHCHFMFSMRRMDELEKERERAPECFFKKARRVYHRKDGTILDNRRQGGCKVPECWNKFGESSAHLRYLRKEFETATNQVLKKYAIAVSVDCRSHKDRYAEAVKEGNEMQARLFSLPPEKHLGPDVANNPNDPAVILLQKQRELRYETVRMIEATERMERVLADRVLAEKQADLQVAAREIEEKTKDITLEEMQLSEAEERELQEKLAAAAPQTDRIHTNLLSYGEAMRKARTSFLTEEEVSLECALRDAIIEKSRLQGELESIELQENELRCAVIAAAKKARDDYDLLGEIERAEDDSGSGSEQNTSDLAPEEIACNVISLAEIQNALDADPEYAALQNRKEQAAAQLSACADSIAANAASLKKINQRFLDADVKAALEEKALCLLKERRREQDEFQKAAALELPLLKQQMQSTGSQIGALQADVILYRQAIEQAKEEYLTELKQKAEERLPEIEAEIAALKQRIEEKESAKKARAEEEDASAQEEHKVLLDLPLGYDPQKNKMWLVKIEVRNGKTAYIAKDAKQWIGAFSGGSAGNPGQFYVHEPEENAVYAVWSKNKETGKSEIVAKAKFSGGKMNPLPVQEYARVIFLEAQKKKLLQEKEMLSIFLKNKIASKEILDLKHQLQNSDLQAKKTDSPRLRKELLQKKETLAAALEKASEGNKDTQLLMRPIQKMFGERKVKSALTHMANKLTQGGIPQRDAIELLQENLNDTIERIRLVMEHQVKAMLEQSIAERMADRHEKDAIARRKRQQECRLTAVEARKTIYDAIAAIRGERQTLERTLAPLETRYISEARARKMAVDAYTKNQTKELRELKRAIQKKTERLEKAKDKLLAKEYALLNTPKPKWYEQLVNNSNVKDYNAAKQAIKTLEQAAAMEKSALYSLELQAAKAENTLNAALKAPEAAAKIEKITEGILKKNEKIAKQVMKLRAQKTRLTHQEESFRELANAATRQIRADQGSRISYAPRAQRQTTSQLDAAAMIARAFNGNAAACAAVARINEDDQSLLDWQAKDEAQRKAERRESAWSRGEF